MNHTILFLLLGIFSLHAEEMPIYQEIADICHPSLEDLLTIQQYQLSADRPILSRLRDTEFIPRTFKMVGTLPEEAPFYSWLAINAPEDERENCVICYSSYNQRYPKGCKRLFAKIAKSDFRGHMHIRIGGWPNIEAGDLALSHVLFAFKPCFFREMQRLGYQRVLWLDASILPVVSLNRIFEMIQEDGYFVQENSHTLEPFMNEDTAHAFNLSFEEACALQSCSAAIIGIDFTNERACQLIDAWYEAAKDPYAFYSPRSDQTAISVLLHKFGMTKWASGAILGNLDTKSSAMLFIMDREYVK